jgi:hypothetical protein
LFIKVNEILSEVNLPLDKIVGQCYDGAANMKGKNKGLASRILSVNPKAFYVHCHCHQLNLALENACCSIPEVRNTIGTVTSIHSFLGASGKRNALFKKVQKEYSLSEDEELVKSIKRLCATRWSSRDKAFESVDENFEVIAKCLKVVC